MTSLPNQPGAPSPDIPTEAQVEIGCDVCCVCNVDERVAIAISTKSHPHQPTSAPSIARVEPSSTPSAAKTDAPAVVLMSGQPTLAPVPALPTPTATTKPIEEKAVMQSKGGDTHTHYAN